MSFLSKATSALGAVALPFVGSTALALGDTFYNDYSSRKAASRQNDYTWSLLNYQNDWNLQQWNRENEYNTPKNIMARYQEAGLNPNLIYGNAYQSPAHLESASGQAPHVQPTKLNLQANFLQLYNMELQNQLLESQIQQIKTNTRNSSDKGSWEEEKRQFERDTGFSWDSIPGMSYRAGDSIAKHAYDYFDGRSNESYEQRMSRNLRELQSQIHYDSEKRPYVNEYDYKSKKFKRKYLTSVQAWDTLFRGE